MFSVGSAPYNGLLQSLYGGRAARKAWLNAVKSGRVKRDAKGRFLPRGSKRRGGGGKKRKNRRYKSSSYDDFGISFSRGSTGSASQAGVDRAAMNLTELKNKWQYYKEFMDEGDAPPPEMYSLAGKIARNLKYLQNAQKYDYFPAVPVPMFDDEDKRMIMGMLNIGFATKRMGGREYDRQVALELASGGDPNMPRKMKRARVRQAMKSAKRKLGGEEMEGYATLWNTNYNDPETMSSFWGTVKPEYSQWDEPYVKNEYMGEVPSAPPLPS